MDSSIEQAQNLLSAVRGKNLTRSERIEKALELSACLLKVSQLERTDKEVKQDARMARMMSDPEGRSFVTSLTDQVFRSHSLKRTANQIEYLIDAFGIPRFLNIFEKMQFLIFKRIGTHFPKLFVPIIRNKIQKETASVLFPEQPKDQIAYFKKSREERIRLNINHLGEAILGEQEAARRLKVYLEDLANPMIEYVSIKISTIFSQINLVSYSTSLEILAERLRLLYQAAMHHTYQRPDGTSVHKFVNLDMEEYKDLHLTVDVFTKVLSEPNYLQTSAGIVLQSYLPDTYDILCSLIQWAKKRKAQGGAPIKIRIVKGANLSMEMVESSLKGWKLATFEHKSETDANFKRMLEYACQKEHAEAAHIGVASHNLFEIAYALILRSENQTESYIAFEMLEGMAKPLRRTLQKLVGEVLLYCPEAKKEDFHTALAYLIRRLDENSGEENFLRHFFEMDPHNLAWKKEKERFTASCSLIDTLTDLPKRTQNRQLQQSQSDENQSFENEPDTDFSLPQNRAWIQSIVDAWKIRSHENIPLVIAGEEIFSSQQRDGRDPSRPGVAAYSFCLADIALADKAITCAAQQANAWGDQPFDARSHLLGKVAKLFRERRADLIGAMMLDGAKTAQEADPEVSEAIDFLEYYRKTWTEQLELGDIKWSPKGTILVTPPWNFPCSIPVSGIAAALTTGNSVLFKPAPEAVLVGWHVAKAFWDAGISKEVLQFIPCPDDDVGSYLIQHPHVASVTLTGSTQTALKFLKLRPGLDLHAETGGKNVIIVTAMSDRDLAVRDIISSAFGHSGQKCSACSLAILEAEVYDDPQFKKQLADAARSLKVGSAWNIESKITPLIRPPEEALLRSLTQLEPGESWLIAPQVDPDNAQLWSPGIKWGVRPNSFTHTTELFGPLLGVMRATSLQEALQLANGTPYGLTSGLHSLDPREQDFWKKHIVAGNLYINRGITGAVVRRQPFGGCKASSFGSGAKAGGPNYVHQFAHPQQQGFPSDKAPHPQLLSQIDTSCLTEQEKEILKQSVASYAYWAPILKKPTDPSHVYGQINVFYHIPLSKAYIRFESRQPTLPLLQIFAACLICETPFEISSLYPLTLPCIVEDELTLLDRDPRRIRMLAPPSFSFQQAAAQKGIMLQTEPPLINGRFELLHYLREISLSHDYHRYGYLGCNPICIKLTPRMKSPAFPGPAQAIYSN
jgi:RHH-type transcriptional regulator, proline utilization regulon repressor / proline dehydrogenase / delta 1-pyrroline-5-carboxylate dehydrogenase